MRAGFRSAAPGWQGATREQATVLRRPSPLAPPLPGETIEY
ncbi:MAG: hypothetical protein QF681_02760 [Vicinamibacterales bacterium]|nr:hypothetical protein [Vicinamibacterales bacterium]